MGGAPWGELLFDGFDGDVDGDFVANVRHVLAHVEVGTLDLGGGVGTDRVLLHHRVRHGVEGGHGQSHWLGDALQGQVTFDAGRLVAFKVRPWLT